MLMQQHFTQLLHLSEAKTLVDKETTVPIVGEVVDVVVAIARCPRVATTTEFKPELNNLPFIER